MESQPNGYHRSKDKLDVRKTKTKGNGSWTMSLDFVNTFERETLRIWKTVCLMSKYSHKSLWCWINKCSSIL